MLFYCRGCWRGSGVARSHCRRCICCRPAGVLGAREAGWAFSAGRETAGERPAPQQQQRRGFFPFLFQRAFQGWGMLPEVAVFFKHRSPSQSGRIGRGKPLQQLCLITLICGEARKASLLNSLQTGPHMPEDFC